MKTAKIKRLLREYAMKFDIIRQPELLPVLVEAPPQQENISQGIVYIVAPNGYKKWAIFRCPKHEEEIFYLSLMPNRRPRWTIRLDIFNRPSIYPSVRQLSGKYLHFWIKKGSVEWCLDSGKKLPLSDFHDLDF